MFSKKQMLVTSDHGTCPTDPERQIRKAKLAESIDVVPTEFAVRLSLKSLSSDQAQSRREFLCCWYSICPLSFEVSCFFCTWYVSDVFSDTELTADVMQIM